MCRVAVKASEPVDPDTLLATSWTFEFRSYTNEEDLCTRMPCIYTCKESDVRVLKGSGVFLRRVSP